MMQKYADDFAVFILTHGRPDTIHTLDTLKRGNYTGKWYLVIDNEDKQAERYYEKYGKERVIMFDKLAISKTFDTADLSQERRAIVYARNACFQIAKDLNLKYFVEFDDDYTSIGIRYPKDGKLSQLSCENLDEIFELMVDFLLETDALTVCMSQGGDHMGGLTGRWKKSILRKAMNSFFCRADRPFQFLGRVNEDVNTYTLLGSQGQLMMTITDLMLNQMQTQSNVGGMTDLYLDGGTYLKSFYTVLYMPSAVTVQPMGTSHKRLHHKVNWKHCVPLILDERCKK